MMNGVRHYLLALQFFTRIPVTGKVAHWIGYQPEMLRSAAAHFPGVGWLIGMVTAAIYAVIDTLLPDLPNASFVSAVLATAAGIWLTGAFHEDGLADVADGLGGSMDRARALEIMRDSRIGSFGAVALVMALLAKVGLVAMLGARDSVPAILALFLSHVLARGWPLVVIRMLPNVSNVNGSKSKPLADSISPSSLAVGGIWCVLALAGVALLTGDARWPLAGLLVSGVACAYMLWLFSRRLAGFTGDCLGATQQVCEVACLFGLAAAF